VTAYQIRFQTIQVMHMTVTLTLADLTDRTGLDVLGHLEREVTIPVIDGLQAQGDLIVVPHPNLGQVLLRYQPWREVPRTGIEVLRSRPGHRRAHHERRCLPDPP